MRDRLADLDSLDGVFDGCGVCIDCDYVDSDCECKTCEYCDRPDDVCICESFLDNAILVICGGYKGKLYVVEDVREEFQRVCTLLGIDVKDGVTSVAWKDDGVIITISCVQSDHDGSYHVDECTKFELGVKFDEIPAINVNGECSSGGAINFIDVSSSEDGHAYLYPHRSRPEEPVEFLLEFRDGEWKAANELHLSRKRPRESEDEKSVIEEDDSKPGVGNSAEKSAKRTKRTNG